MIGTIIICKFETPPHSANPPQEASATVLTMFYKTEAQIKVRDHFLLFLIFLESFMPWEQQRIEKKMRRGMSLIQNHIHKRQFS